MRTMDEMYGDKSNHEACEECGMCVTCGDCDKYGCSLGGKNDIPPTP